MCKRLEAIKERVKSAAERAGRNPSDIKIVAVSKKKPASQIKELYGCGQRLFGENYIQEAIKKIEGLSNLKDISWHFIGHLQRNKAKFAVRYFDWIETVDSIRLARAINKKAGQIGKKINILVQVNIGREESKSGFLEEDVRGAIEVIRELDNLNLRGLMTIPPRADTAEDSRVWFKKLALLKKQLTNIFPTLSLKELSMGMSRDFEVAIEEGATIVRIGTSLFGPRD